MSVTTQKLMVGILSLALVVALAVAGRVDTVRHPAAISDSAAVAALANPQIARGRAVFIKYSCNACHGTDARGGIRNLNAETGGEISGLLHSSESFTKEELADRIRNGVANVEKADAMGPEPPLKMPAYKDLIAGQEMQDLIAYLWGLGGGEKKKSGAW